MPALNKRPTLRSWKGSFQSLSGAAVVSITWKSQAARCSFSVEPAACFFVLTSTSTLLGGRSLQNNLPGGCARLGAGCVCACSVSCLADVAVCNLKLCFECQRLLLIFMLCEGKKKMLRGTPPLLPFDQSESSGVCETRAMVQRRKLQASPIQRQKPVESGSQQNVRDEISLFTSQGKQLGSQRAFFEISTSHPEAPRFILLAGGGVCS